MEHVFKIDWTDRQVGIIIENLGIIETLGRAESCRYAADRLAFIKLTVTRILNVLVPTVRQQSLRNLFLVAVAFNKFFRIYSTLLVVVHNLRLIFFFSFVNVGQLRREHDLRVLLQIDTRSVDVDVLQSLARVLVQVSATVRQEYFELAYESLRHLSLHHGRSVGHEH